MSNVPPYLIRFQGQEIDPSADTVDAARYRSLQALEVELTKPHVREGLVIDALRQLNASLVAIKKAEYIIGVVMGDKRFAKHFDLATAKVEKAVGTIATQYIRELTFRSEKE